MKKIILNRVEYVKDYYYAEYDEEDFEKEVKENKIKFLDMETTFDNLMKVFNEDNHKLQMEFKGYNGSLDKTTIVTTSIFEYFSDIMHDLCWDSGARDSEGEGGEDEFETEGNGEEDKFKIEGE